MNQKLLCREAFTALTLAAFASASYGAFDPPTTDKGGVAGAGPAVVAQNDSALPASPSSGKPDCSSRAVVKGCAKTK